MTANPTIASQSHLASHVSTDEYLLRQGIVKLLEIKDSDIRIWNIEQCRDAVDKGLHSGGASSAVIPLVALYYGGFININVSNPTERGQDLFVLSKGHAVATLASIYADLGYFDRSWLKNSRSYESRLNGHPGPLLPGVHIATGPMGQGLSVAQGFAIIGRSNPHFDCYCLVGDGEMQEGAIWEAVMYAGQNHLDNLCVLVDQNNGQLDVVNRMVFPMPRLESVLESFNWRVYSIDATQYTSVYAALANFKYEARNGQPSAIICHSTKGYGSFSDFMNRHKVTVPDNLITQELKLHLEQRRVRVEEFTAFYKGLEGDSRSARIQSRLRELAHAMHLKIEGEAWGDVAVRAQPGPVLLHRAPERDKAIQYDAAMLPKIDRTKEYTTAEIVTAAMKVFATDPRVISIDADLASTSGLEAGVAAVDQRRALNVGVAETNMMNLGEAFAALGYNTWISTFCPFWDWKAFRRIAVGYQERLEAMGAEDGWLSQGHGLDLTFLSTAANFETRTNGATHMGNDDVTIFDGLAHLKMIDVSCPQQLLSIMQWIMEGNRGLVYVRVMRAPSTVIYGPDFRFEFGRAYLVREARDARAVIVSSGRGVHEAIAAAAECGKYGIEVSVVDMPSIDEDFLMSLHDSGKLLCIAEQNNGFILQNYLKALFRRRKNAEWSLRNRVLPINALDTDGKPRFIHSGNYDELLRAFGLAPEQIAAAILNAIEIAN